MASTTNRNTPEPLTGSVAPLLLRGGTVIDGTGRPPQPATDVLIVDGRIAAVGGAANAAAANPSMANPLMAIETVDCAGLTVMPGLIDAHCHISFAEPQSNDELFFHRPQTTSALLAAFNVRKLLLAGVTGFLDADCIFDIGPSLRDAIEAGIVEGPRMRSGMNALLTTAGGTAGRLIPESGTLGYARVVGDRDEMVKATRQQIKQGADWIKVHVTGLVPGRSGEQSVWSPGELAAVVDAAHQLDTPAVAHCRSAQSTLMAAQAGVDLILHGSFMDEPALEAVVASGAALCPTFTFLANLVDHGAKVGAATSQVDLFRGEISATAAMMRRAHDAGVKLLTGSESGFSLTPYGHWHARELELFVTELGLTPLEAITCATANGALALRMQGAIGTVEEAMAADVIVVEGDPSTDITVLADRSNLRHVISRGRTVDISGPWPQRRPLPGEKVSMWSTELLTRDASRR